MPSNSRLFALALAFSTFAAIAQDQPKPKVPIATITAGWTYLYSDQGMNYRSNLNGWFIKPSVTIGKGYAGFADFTNYYGTNKKGSINTHGFTFGLQKDIFARPKLKPSIFAEAGDVRASNAGTITQQLSVNAGLNLSIPLAKWVSLSLTPAEYIFNYPNGDQRNNYNAKVGFTFPIGRR